MASIQDLWSGKTSKARSRPIKARTSDASLKHSHKLKIPQLLFLNLKMANGMAREASWEMVTPSLGEPWMLSIGEFPKEENASTLSQILEENVPEKFYLSRKAVWAFCGELPRVAKNYQRYSKEHSRNRRPMLKRPRRGANGCDERENFDPSSRIPSSALRHGTGSHRKSWHR